MATAIMMQGAAFLQRHADHLLLGGSCRLADRFGHFARLAMAEADPALAIAHDDQRSETEALAALDGLGNAVDVNELFDQLLALLFLGLAPAIVPAATATTVATAAAFATTAAPTAPAPRAFAFYSRRNATACA
jgi:hypothetical protein